MNRFTPCLLVAGAVLVSGAATTYNPTATSSRPPATERVLSQAVYTSDRVPAPKQAPPDPNAKFPIGEESQTRVNYRPEIQGAVVQARGVPR